MPSALASAALGSCPAPGRADCIAFSSALVETPSLLASVLRSGRWPADGAVALPLLAFLALSLLAAPQPAAPTNAVAPTITASLRMRGFLIVMVLSWGVTTSVGRRPPRRLRRAWDLPGPRC